MSIQSNINQGISLVSLLASQNPNLQETARVNREYNYSKQRAESRKAAATGEIHYNKDGLVALKYKSTGADGKTTEVTQDVVGMAHARKSYLSELERMYDLKPSQETLDEISKVKGEIEKLETAHKRSAKAGKEVEALEEAKRAGIREKAKTEEEGRLEARSGEFAEKAREAHEADVRAVERARYEEKEAYEIRREERKTAAEEKRIAREEAEAAARVAGEEEARRLAISRSITEGIFSTDPAFDPRYTGGKKK